MNGSSSTAVQSECRYGKSHDHRRLPDPLLIRSDAHCRPRPLDSREGGEVNHMKIGECPLCGIEIRGPIIGLVTGRHTWEFVPGERYDCGACKGWWYA